MSGLFTASDSQSRTLAGPAPANANAAPPNNTPSAPALKPGHESVGDGFISHLFGLDQGNRSHGSPIGNGLRSQALIWASALESLNWSTLTRGINFNANFAFLMLFISFFLWLFLIHFIKHHEDLADKMIGTVPLDMSAYTDRDIVDKVKLAIPIRLQSDRSAAPQPAPASASSIDSSRYPYGSAASQAPLPVPLPNNSRAIEMLFGRPRNAVQDKSDPRSMGTADNNASMASTMTVPQQTDTSMTPSTAAAPQQSNTFSLPTMPSSSYTQYFVPTPAPTLTYSPRLKIFVNH